MVCLRGLRGWQIYPSYHPYTLCCVVAPRNEKGFSFLEPGSRVHDRRAAVKWIAAFHRIVPSLPLRVI